MNDSFFIIGQVVEVAGTKVKARIYRNKNSHVFTYQGIMIRNVSVGSYVKIKRGYSDIIAKIEGEYISETSNTVTPERFTKESETIDRIIEVSLIGVMENNSFRRGVIEVPLVFSDVFMLNNKEMDAIFDFCRDRDNAVVIGCINDYKEQKLAIDVQLLFANHIGIFGNTGSGKSNTLAKLFTEAINKFSGMRGFAMSQFIVIDFNGEYTDCFGSKKLVYHLSTRRHDSDKIRLGRSFLTDVDIWSIICGATEKTQQPFLRRSINKYVQIFRSCDTQNYIFGMIRNLIQDFFGSPDMFVRHIPNLKRMLSVVSMIAPELDALLDNIELFGQGTSARLRCNGNYANTLEEYERLVCDPICSLITIKDVNGELFDPYELLNFSILFTFIEETRKRHIVEEHISPLIGRFTSQIENIRKTFDVREPEPESQIEIISLADVNIDIKKIIPLIVCKSRYEAHRQKPRDSRGSLHIIVDEAHNILSDSSERESQIWKDYRLETFEEIIKEGRKFGVFLTIASQRPSDISETIISQLHNYFIHRLVNQEDLRAISRAVSFIDKTSYDMIPVLPQGCCIFSGIASNFPVMVQIELLPCSIRPHSETINLVDLWSASELDFNP